MIKTSIQWSTPLSLSLLISLVAGVILAFVLLRMAVGKPLPTSGRLGLWALRILVLMALALILLNPVRVEETPGAVERPGVAYLLDASQSMALGKADQTRWNQAVASIRDSEPTGPVDLGPRVGAYRFGNRLEAIDRPFWRPARSEVGPGSQPPSEPAPAPTDADTLLGGSLEALAARFGQSAPRAVVVFSDGRTRDGDRATAIARGFRRMNVPIHAVPVGDDNVGGDVAIVSMVVPNLARKSTSVPVRLFVRSYGYKGRRSEVKLVALGPDGRPATLLSKVPVVLQDGLSSYALTFESGETDRRIAAIIDPQPGEVSSSNNTFAAEVSIDRTKIRVLYLEGIAERTIAKKGLFGLGGSEVVGAYSPLQKALREDPDIECTAIVPSGSEGDFSSIARIDDGRGLPETPSELFAYDAIILSNVPREVLSDKFMAWIDEWIGRRGGGLCMVGGPNSFGSGKWANTPIGRMLPVEIEPANRDWEEAPAAIKPIVDGSIHPIWHIAADDSENRAILKTLPNFLGHNKLGSPKSTAEVLARVGSGSPDGDPAVAVQPYGRGRTMAVAPGITRRFAPEFAQSWGQGDSRYYQKFWRNVTYWLTENSSIGRRRLLAETDKRLYRPGEPIVLKARAFDENASSTLEYRVAVSIEPRSAAESTPDNSPLRKPSIGPAPADDRAPLLPWGEEFDLEKLAEDKSYITRLPIAIGKDLPAGVSLTQGLRIELTAYENNTQVDSTALDVQILDDPTEQQNPLPDHALLRRLAEESGGRVLNDSKALAAMLAELPVAVGPSQIKAMPVWSQWWLLVILITLLTTEWIWRRRIGLA